MPSSLRIHELPFLTAGLPQPLEEWLRLGGVPAVPFTSAVGRTIHPGGSSAQILLYDSRDKHAGRDVALANDRKLRVVDTAGIWERGAGTTNQSRNERQVRSRILERLKTSIENAGGLWMRIGDYPFPYQSAACFGTEGAEKFLPWIAAAFEPLPARFAAAVPVACRQLSDSTYLVDQPFEVGVGTGVHSTHDDMDSWIRRRYAQGLPLAVPGAVPAFDGDVPFDARKLPLLWRTTFEEFSTWWRHRAAIRVRARCKGNTLQIECDDDFGGFPPMVELWRGKHLASFPLQAGRMTVREDGLVFQQEHNRHPAGFAPIWAEGLPSENHRVKNQLRSA